MALPLVMLLGGAALGVLARDLLDGRGVPATNENMQRAKEAIYDDPSIAANTPTAQRLEAEMNTTGDINSLVRGELGDGARDQQPNIAPASAVNADSDSQGSTILSSLPNNTNPSAPDDARVSGNGQQGATPSARTTTEAGILGLGDGTNAGAGAIPSVSNLGTIEQAVTPFDSPPSPATRDPGGLPYTIDDIVRGGTRGAKSFLGINPDTASGAGASVGRQAIPGSGGPGPSVFDVGPDIPNEVLTAHTGQGTDEGLARALQQQAQGQAQAPAPAQGAQALPFNAFQSMFPLAPTNSGAGAPVQLPNQAPLPVQVPDEMDAMVMRALMQLNNQSTGVGPR